MAKITRIKASDGPAKKEADATPALTRKKVVVKDKKTEKAKKEAVKTREKAAKKAGKSSEKKGFILFRPFVAFFRYLRDAWREIRQVRWPNGKATWKMVLAVFVYTAIFIVAIVLLDMFFSWLFSLIIK